MHLLYYDEVKYHPKEQPQYWLGGVCIPYYEINEIENKVSEIAKEIFKSNKLIRETEIHGIELIRGKGNFKGKKIEKRTKWLKKILSVIAQQNIKRIHVRINPNNNTNNKNDAKNDDKGERKIAFEKLAEQADTLFKKINTYGMLVGDYEENYIKLSVNSLLKMRQEKTQRIIDTAYFVRSHHSRMIQLADVYIYCTQFIEKENDSWWRKIVEEVIQNSGITNNTHKYP